MEGDASTETAKKEHFIRGYAAQVNEILHTYLVATYFYKHEIYEVPGLLSALLITYDNQADDEFVVQPKASWQDFLTRMSRVKRDWANFSSNGEMGRTTGQDNGGLGGPYRLLHQRWIASRILDSPTRDH